MDIKIVSNIVRSTAKLSIYKCVHLSQFSQVLQINNLPYPICFFFIGVYVRRKIKRGTEVGEICIGNLKILGKECDNALAFHLSNSLYIE